MNPANIVITAWKTFDSMPKLPISPTSIPIACTVSFGDALFNSYVFINLVTE